MQNLRKFENLTNILSDKCLSLSHSSLEDSLIVYGNDGLWSVKEKEEIIDRAVKIYLNTNKRRKKVGQPVKKRKRDEEIASDESQELASPLVTHDSDSIISDSDYSHSDDELLLSESDSDWRNLLTLKFNVRS